MTEAEPAVVVVGAGLTGLTLALDLGLRGVPVVLLERNQAVQVSGLSSRGLAYAKRSLEIFDRLGVAERIAAEGVTWSRGRIYDGDTEIVHFDVLADTSQRWPAFVNVPQSTVEQHLLDRTREVGDIDLRFGHRVTGVEQSGSRARLTVETAGGTRVFEADWVVACDGTGSTVRDLLGATPPATRFDDTWCIADARVGGPPLDERRFFLNSPLVDGGAVILHQMARGFLRTDWQLSHFADPDAEATPERTAVRLGSLLGDGADFEIVELSRWRFRVRLMDSMVHGRVIFAGDAAHEIPPFGARGGNSGIQDADNLAWKLQAIIAGRAGDELLATYDLERSAAARENAALASGSAVFVTPHTPAERAFRDAVLAAAHHDVSARALVDTGRLSTATAYGSTPLSLPDTDTWTGGIAPGEAAIDGPAGDGHLLGLLGPGFTALHFVADPASFERDEATATEVAGFALAHVVVSFAPFDEGETTMILDPAGALFQRYGAGPSACYLLRPDGHVSARRRAAGTELARDLLANVLRQAGVGA